MLRPRCSHALWPGDMFIPCGRRDGHRGPHRAYLEWQGSTPFSEPNYPAVDDLDPLERGQHEVRP